ncbi:MAG: PIN domain-containing protein [Deltaproteobacteria bacterium]|nr:PIN domain-containing protein [Deltaproteobacteria bacterium]MBK8695938.1 PIN domain-containing protein [Deltaproteobacteria bacterium]MBP6829153.1 PIN domain-containing protein [Deltaproteobacteria bacterium]
MAFIVVYDACVLYPAPLRDLLVRVALTGLVQAKWTDRILDECFLNVAANRPELSSERLRRTRELMIAAVRDCMVTGCEPLIDGLELSDPDDRHVLAAAIRSNAQVIVTANLKDFPKAALAPYGVEPLHPDEFVLGLVDLAPGVMVRVVAEQAAALRNPIHTIAQLLDTLRSSGLARSVARLRELSGS